MPQHFVPNGFRPRTNFVVTQQRHRPDLTSAVALLAVFLQHRNNIAVKSGLGGRGGQLCY